MDDLGVNAITQTYYNAYNLKRELDGWLRQ